MLEDFDKHMTRAFTEVIQNGQDVLFEDIHFERIPKEDIIPTTHFHKQPYRPVM